MEQGPSMIPNKVEQASIIKMNEGRREEIDNILASIPGVLDMLGKHSDPNESGDSQERAMAIERAIATIRNTQKLLTEMHIEDIS